MELAKCIRHRSRWGLNQYRRHRETAHRSRLIASLWVVANVAFEASLDVAAARPGDVNVRGVEAAAIITLAVAMVPITTPVPMGSSGWRDVGGRARFQFFFIFRKIANGAAANSLRRSPETFAMVDGWMSTGARMVAVDVAIAHREPRDVAGWSMVGGLA
jgi:hypothetical protein